MKLSGSSIPSKREQPPQGKSDRLRWEPICLPPEVRRGLSLKASVYLKERGFDPGWLVRRLGFCDWEDIERIVIPYFDRAGECIFLAARSYVGERPKYMYPQGPKPLYVPTRTIIDGPAVIVEGQLDAAAVVAAGVFTVALGGSYLAPHAEQDLVEELGGRRSIILLDGDALGKSVILSGTLARLGVYPSMVCLLPGEDPASLGTDKLKELLHGDTT